MELGDKIKKVVFSLFLVLLFFILSYDKLHFPDENLYLYAAAFLNSSEWSNNPYTTFFVSKYGTILILNILIGLVGIGLKGLFIIELVYALMVLGFVYISYLILKELLDNKKDAIYTSIILMFLPLTLIFYLRIKTEK